MQELKVGLSGVALPCRRNSIYISVCFFRFLQIVGCYPRGGVLGSSVSVSPPYLSVVIPSFVVEQVFSKFSSSFWSKLFYM